MFGVLNCSDPFAIENGNKMYDWVNQTLKEWSKDPSIVWTATVQHHPMFSKWWADYLQITSNMMPMINSAKDMMGSIDMSQLGGLADLAGGLTEKKQ